jgi:uracil-DNA glycosylase
MAADEDLEQLLREVRAEAESAPFPLDEEVYRSAGRDPLQPIFYAGNLAAPFCVVGRDLGRDEVKLAQPQVGAAGRRVRTALLEAAGVTPQPKDRHLEAALELALLTNLAPYKPPGNKAYSVAVRERFRPFLERLLVNHWQGERVLTLGTEAFQWFTRYAEAGAVETLWARNDRYEQELPCVLCTTVGGEPMTRAMRVAPLPHPSPLNQTWFARFPELMLGHLRRPRSG